MTVALQDVAPELQDEIISYLWDDIPSLKSCSLSCRDMTSPSHRRLFYSIALRPSLRLLKDQYSSALWYKSLNGTAVEFERLLHMSPHIAGYVKALHLFDRRELYGDDPRPSCTTTTTTTTNTEKLRWPSDFQWLHKDTALSRCLPLLHSLRALNADCDKELQSQATLLHCLRHHPSLEFVQINNVPLATAGLLDGMIDPHVKHLIHRQPCDTFSFPTGETPTGPPTVEPDEPVYLDSLNTNRPSTFAAGAGAEGRIRTSRLRKLGIVELVVTDLEHEAAWAILQTCRDTLEEFEFRPSMRNLDTTKLLSKDSIIDLGQFPRLRALTVDLGLHFRAETLCFDWLCRLLGTAISPTTSTISHDHRPSSSSLEEISLFLGYTFDCLDSLDHWQDVWDVLSSLLSMQFSKDKRNLRRLRRLTILVTGSKDPSKAMAEALDGSESVRRLRSYGHGDLIVDIRAHGPVLALGPPDARWQTCYRR